MKIAELVNLESSCYWSDRCVVSSSAHSDWLLELLSHISVIKDFLLQSFISSVCVCVFRVSAASSLTSANVIIYKTETV